MSSDAREVALNAIGRCRRSKAWSGLTIDNEIKQCGLDRRDSALASRICLGVLQNESLFDFYTDCFSSTKSGKLESAVRDILHLGMYQILFMDKIPDSAAVNQCVAMCRGRGCERASGLVNAVLRKISANKENLPEIPGNGTAEYLAVKYSHPVCLAERLVEEKGFGFAEAFFACNNEAPKTFIQLNTLRVEVRDYLRALMREDIEFRYDDSLPGCVQLSSGRVTRLPGFEEGLFYVQDKAARMAVEICAPEPGMRVLDSCSAPGGKAFAAAVRMKNTGEIVSWDIHGKKLNLVSSGAERLGLDIISCEARDARVPDKALNDSFDAVIADVPCSGMGVIGKKPEIRCKSDKEIGQLPQIQTAIIANLANFVKVGGTLLYSTCTVLREENEDVVEKFLASHRGFALEGFECAGISAPEGYHTFWPNVDGTDGFFAAKLKRIN